MNNKDLLWYLGYGSNLNRERFLFYITSGTPEGHSKGYDGCRDKTLPKKEDKMIISHDLYFAESSDRWENGGVAFIKNEEKEGVQTYGRLYLITRQQMEDIAKQETASENLITIDFDEAVRNGSTIFKNPSWYGKMLYLGEKDNHPVFTITSQRHRTPTGARARYISTIADGIRKTFNLSDEEVAHYFYGREGVKLSHEIVSQVVKDSNKP